MYTLVNVERVVRDRYRFTGCGENSFLHEKFYKPINYKWVRGLNRKGDYRNKEDLFG